MESMMSRRILLFSLIVAAMILMSGGGALADDAEICSDSTIYLTIFNPAEGEELDLFYAGAGKSCLYALDCKTGEAVFNFDTSNDAREDALLRTSDREPRIAIPPGMVIALTWSMSSSYIGLGGAIDNSDLSTPKGVLRIYWRYVF